MVVKTSNIHTFLLKGQLLLLLSNASRLQSRIYIAGKEGEEGRQKTRKSRSEEKLVGFSSVSLFLKRKREAVTRVEIEG